MASRVKCWNCSGVTYPGKFSGKSAAIKCANCLAGMKVTKGKKKTSPAVPGLAKADRGQRIEAPAFLGKSGKVTRAEAVGALEANLRRYQAGQDSPPLDTSQRFGWNVPDLLKMQTYSADPAMREHAWSLVHQVDTGQISKGRVS